MSDAVNPTPPPPETSPSPETSPPPETSPRPSTESSPTILVRSARRRVLLMASSMRGGGSEHQTALLARHLDRDDFDVHLYLTHRDGDLIDTLPSDVTLHSPPAGLGTRSWLRRVPGHVMRCQQDWFFECVRAHRIDVIYDRTFHMTFVAGLGKRHRIPRVSTIVSPPDVALPTVEKRFVRRKRAKLATAYRSAARVIAVSDAVADSAARFYGLTHDSILTIRNPVDVDGIRAAAGWSIGKPLPVPEGRTTQTPVPPTLTLVCVGRMSVEKGQADLLTAFIAAIKNGPSELPGLRLRMIGDGPDRRALEATWASFAQSERAQSEGAQSERTVRGHSVEFPGVIHPSASEISGADGLVLPSHFEGMPNVVLEAFALRTPVIATMAGGAAELMGTPDQPTGYWARPKMPAELSRQLLAWAMDRPNWHHRTAAAERLIRDRHGIETAVSQIAAVLRIPPPTPSA